MIWTTISYYLYLFYTQPLLHQLEIFCSILIASWILSALLDWLPVIYILILGWLVYMSTGLHNHRVVCTPQIFGCDHTLATLGLPLK